ncbi:methylation [Candidatus Koribacter versatilis Ellin345]|uniref:Methylation n=1 Tax=Koribacter versatilis (strain Ellin345) TaxID=204669 RepID=Q1ISH0_KORVE|nr:prepilin-type N-terminal cleavage/methylation domain-containing protein [Candidatus Koribacter versatilis]ABF40180.1 methylation [Candidatus Koribacter versatilis Ellin345]
MPIEFDVPLSTENSRTTALRCSTRAHFRAPRKQQGFTLIELVVVVAIILTIAAIAIPNFMQAVRQARIARAVGDIRAIVNDIQAYNVTYDKYPDTLDDIGRSDTKDPWGDPYQYLNFADTKGKGKQRKDRFLVPINSYFDLYSMGEDKLSVPPLTAKQSQDDIIYASDGSFVGLASDY